MLGPHFLRENDGVLLKGTPMRPRHPAPILLVITAAAALSLAACADYAPAGSGGASTETAVPPPSPAPTSAPTPAGMVTYTFPDGRLSFAHPADWRVVHEQVSASPPVETAAVIDANGAGRVNIYYSQVGDAVAGPDARFVLAADPVPGLVSHTVPTPHSSFFADHVNGAVEYRMGLTAGLPVSPDGKVQNGPVMLGDRILAADVLFTGPPFANDEAAKAWYWGGDGQKLKALLMSFSYR